MALKASVPILLTCTTIFLPTSTSASLNGQLAERQLAGRHPLTRSIDARDRSNTLPLTTQDPSNLPNDASDKPPTSNMTSCQTYGCNLFYQYANVWYFGTGRQNTACPSLGSPSEVTNNLPELSMVPPSIYVIFPTIYASDGCNQIGNGYGPITTSFAPGELSTIEIRGISTKVYDFSELPCPPSSIKVPPGAFYAPLLAPPSFMYALDPAFSTCIPAADQGVDAPIDPPIALTTAHGGLEGPGALDDNLPPRDLGAQTLLHAGTTGPAKTAEPMRITFSHDF